MCVYIGIYRRGQLMFLAFSTRACLLSERAGIASEIIIQSQSGCVRHFVDASWGGGEKERERILGMNSRRSSVGKYFLVFRL